MLEVLSLVAIISLVLLLRRKNTSTSLPYPPGPQGLPIVGNIFDFPKDGSEWEFYIKCGERLDSDIIHFNNAGSHIVVLNSLSDVLELLDKRSAKYSSRAPFTMANELSGWGWLVGNKPYGRQWRTRRKIFQQHFDPSDPSLYTRWQLYYGKILLKNLLESPEQTWEHLHHTISGATVSVTYGIEVRSMDDPFIKLAIDGSQSLIDTLVPGKYLVDSIPLLKRLPAWVPGCGFKREANQYRKLTEQFREEPFVAALRAIDQGLAQPSFVSQCLQRLSDTQVSANEGENDEYTAIIDMAASIYVGGADTTLSGVATILLAMICFPEVQKRAQKELDSMLGHGRLPELEDKESLPYLMAVILEAFRWRPAFPTALPHYTTEDDEYKGYYIPKNTVVIPNTWAILHDKNIYPEPDKFIPERFLTADGKLDPKVQDPTIATFGYGRRECPGKHVGMSATWIIIAYILSAFNVEIPRDPITGENIQPSMKYRSGLVYSPVPFKFKVTPRSEATIEMIRLLDL